MSHKIYSLKVLSKFASIFLDTMHVITNRYEGNNNVQQLPEWAIVFNGAHQYARLQRLTWRSERRRCSSFDRVD